jgi:DNA polymerase
MNDFCHIDFETRSAADLTKVGADVYSQDISTDALCLAYAFNDEPIEIWLPEMPPPQKLLDHVAKGGICRGHNIGAFEMLIWNNVMTFEYDWLELKIEQCQDTMAMAYAMSLPGSLDDASRAAGIDYNKDMKGHRVMLQLSQPREILPDGSVVWWEKSDVPEKFDQLYAYCIQDVEVERALCKRLMQLSKNEQKLWQLDFKINRRGVHVDLVSAQVALQVVEEEKTRLNLKMRDVTGNAVGTCTATGQLTDWLKSKGCEVPSVAKADVIDMLSKPLPTECRDALLLRQEAAKTSTAKLQAMIKGASASGRMRGLFQYHGASTGRWAGRRVQLQNLPRPKLRQDQVNEVFRILGEPEYRDKAEVIRKFVGAPLSAISDCIRGFLRARPGHDFIACDFESIEARVIAWLAGEEKSLEVFKGDGKIYELTAADVFGCKAEEISKDDPRRQVGKVVVLSMGFAGGVGALQTMCKAYGVSLEPVFDIIWSRATEDHKDRSRFLWNLNGEKSEISKKEFFASDLVKQFWREANPKIVEYWSDLETAAICAVKKPGEKFFAGAVTREVTYVTNGSFLWCRLPSGRVLCYPYPKVEMLSPFKDSSAKETITYMGVDSYSHKWERQKSYGGLLSENVTQAVSRDLLSDALFRLEGNKYPVVAHVHDEIICEIPKHFGSVPEVEKIMCETPIWAQGLPISAKGWRNERYKK